MRALELQPGISSETRRRVLELRRRHSFREVARLAGLEADGLLGDPATWRL